MVQELVIGAFYKHYKNKMYKVVGIAHHSENLEKMVVYEALYDAGGDIGKNSLWVRPKSMFLETIEHEGEMIPRYTLVGLHTA